jgi:hypothetical protein
MARIQRKGQIQHIISSSSNIINYGYSWLCGAWQMKTQEGYINLDCKTPEGRKLCLKVIEEGIEVEISNDDDNYTTMTSDHMLMGFDILDEYSFRFGCYSAKYARIKDPNYKEKTRWYVGKDYSNGKMYYDKNVKNLLHPLRVDKDGYIYFED